MSLLKPILAAIKEEIAKDPEGLGYAGKTDQEVLDLLNKPYTKTETVEMTMPPRITQLLHQVPFAANSLDIIDLTEAKKEK